MEDIQQRALEQLYNQTSKPTVAQKEQIARMLNLPTVVVQTWFTERRARAKEDKRMEEAQARAALENAHQAPAFDVTSIIAARPKTHRTQSEASYASLARSLKAAAASMPVTGTDYDRSTSPSYSTATSPQSYSPTSTDFDSGSVSMARNDSQWSNMSTPTDFGDFQNYPCAQSYYMPTTQAMQNTMIYEEAVQEATRPIEMHRGPLSRPRMQRTWTAPETCVRQPIYRSVSMPITNENAMPESMPVRRRPKLSPLGVGMARSRSSLGYENEPISSTRRTPCTSDFPYPLTPVRRIASTTAVPTLAGMKYNSTFKENTVQSKFYGKGADFSNDSDLSLDMQFPPSPISPEHGVQQQGLQTAGMDFSSLADQTILEDVFTPPQTPLTALSTSCENVLANLPESSNIWTNNAFKMSEADFMHKDMTLTDVFSDEMLALESY